MLGRTHALSGAVVGLAVGPLVGLHTLAELAPFTVATAGAALIPDLDHPGARASKVLGPITGAVSRGLRFVSGRLYQATKGPRDESWSGKHRHLTHTAVFALLLGVLTAVSTAAGGPWAVAAVGGFVAMLGVGALGDWALAAVGVGLGPLLASGDPVAALTSMQGWLGVAVAVGCLTHDLGDSLTVSGCPWLWPIPWRGETWAEIRLLGPASFHTGKRVEHLLVFPAFIVAAVLLAPGVGPWLWRAAVDLWTQV